jgi:predicted nucleic acid-binding protein
VAYLDTSVLGSYYCPETASRAVNRFMASLEQAVISPLVELEFCSLLALKVRVKNLTPAAAQRVLAQFRLHRAENRYSVLEIGPREYDLAATWLCGFHTNLRTLDALHLATAFASRQEMWTTDKLLAGAANELGVPCRLISA